MDLELIVLDWSGTVSHDCDAVMFSYNRVMEHYGKIPNTWEEFQQDYQPSIAGHYKSKGITASLSEIQKLFVEFLQATDPPVIIPGADEALREAKKIAPLALFTSHPASEVRADLARYGMNDVFDHVMSDARKYDAIDGELLLRSAGVGDRKKVLYIGDTTVDIDAGHALGVMTAVVSMPEHSYNTVERARSHRPPAHFHMDHICELPEVLRNPKKFRNGA